MSDAGQTLGPSIAAPVARIEAFARDFLLSRALPDNLHHAVEYALLGPGKRLRPLLAVHCCRAAGGDEADALPAACAVEMVHAFSLVHDDLPALDNDDLRRGRPTLHRHTSEAMAILAGDGLLTLAFDVLIERTADAALARRLLQELSAATRAMIAGQVFDTLGGLPAGAPPDRALELIHRNKTGALIRAACTMGAMSSPACAPAALQAVAAYGEHLGLLFQIVDDVLDVTQPTSHLGKTAGKDSASGKTTFPGVLGLEESRRRIDLHRRAAVETVAPFGPEAEPLRQLAAYIARRTR